MTAGQNPFEALFQSEAYMAREAAYQRDRADRRAAFLEEHGDEWTAWPTGSWMAPRRAVSAPWSQCCSGGRST